MLPSLWWWVTPDPDLTGDRWSADPGPAQASKVRKKPGPCRLLEPGVWSEAGSRVKMILTLGRGYSSVKQRVTPGPSLWWPPSDGGPRHPSLGSAHTAHLTGPGSARTQLTLCSTLPTQRCNFSPPQWPVLCKWITQLPRAAQSECEATETCENMKCLIDIDFVLR